MKPSEDQIKQAFLHADPIVRSVALEYFTLSFSRDRGVMPMAIQAIEKYGWKEAFGRFWPAQNLPQTDETLLWLLGQLEGPRHLPESAVERICSLISHADAELLGRHQSRLDECHWLDGESRKAVREKIQLLSVSGETCWKELEGLCDRHKDDRDSQQFEFGRAARLVEAISREGDRHADRVLSVLSQKIENLESNPLAWLEIFAAMLAGLIRLDSAAPWLAARLKDDDGDFMNEQCTYALTKIGGDAAIEAIAKDFHSAPSHFRLYASSALHDMRGDKVVAKALELLKGPQPEDADDWDIPAAFIGTALANFDPEGLRAAREYGIDDLSECRRELIATVMLTGENFPELEQVREEERQVLARIQRRQEWFFGGGKTAVQPTAIVPFDEPVAQPIRSGPKIGRNEPCPCGSGKKYKKCCLNKQQVSP